MMSMLLAMVSDAEACSVCFSATENTRGVYLETTILMSLAPLLFIWVTAHMMWSRRVSLTDMPRSGSSDLVIRDC